jgi:hypothetical protein
MRAYINGPPSAASTTTTTPPQIATGRYLAKAHLSRRQRARYAAALSTGTVRAYPLTIQQAASIMKVPVLDVSRARRNGKRASTGRSNGHAETLADHIARSSAAERLAAARVIGPAALWDSMISPIVDEDRAAE